MDGDRKSAVSSFYGAKTSMDPLNAGAREGMGRPSGAGAGAGHRPSRDDASSFFQPERGAGQAQGQSNSAGYNRNSFFYAGREEPLKGGRDEEEAETPGWDIYADFNNAGPKYSSNFPQLPSVASDSGYRQIGKQSGPSLASPLMKQEELALSSGQVEMVTVPALGPEWQKEELRNMTKAGRREKKYETRQEKWKAWNRGQTGICGRYCTRKQFVFSVFGLFGIIGVILGFTIPRVPGIQINGANPLIAASGRFADSVPIGFSRAPANFSFPGVADLQLDTTSNWLPLTINKLYARVFDLDTLKQVGQITLGKMTFPAKSFPQLLLPMNFTYSAFNDTDPTWVNWYDSCKNSAIYPDGVRRALAFRLHIEMEIAGLPSKASTSTQVSDADCPIELSISAA